METAPIDPGSQSDVLQKVDDICTRYDKVFEQLQSNEEDDEEERWLLKEATKNAIDLLEKQAFLKSKPMILLTRALTSRAQRLIEKCEQVFPQLEELVRLKSLKTEIDSLLTKSAFESAPNPNCLLCSRFGSYRLLAQGVGEDENIFLFVAEKIAGSKGDRRASKPPKKVLEEDRVGRARERRRRSREPVEREKSKPTDSCNNCHKPPRPCNDCHKPPEWKGSDKKPLPEENPVDLIVSADLGSRGRPPGLSVRVQEKGSSGVRSTMMLILTTVFALNLVVQFVLWLYNSFVSTTALPGAVLWPLYCKVANRLCKADYEFACLDYCSSRLERFMWGKKLM